MLISKENLEQFIRTDDCILADIWDALWKIDTVRSLDMSSLSIHVKDGEVCLTGHLARDNNLLLIDRVAHSVAAVVAVHNYLVTDRDLIIQVARALAGDERSCPFILPVGASHGWINLGGEVPSRAIQCVVEKVAGGVSGVRGVITLPKVTGESPGIPRRAVQPRIGAVVYGENGKVGVVTHVVIQPDNRLVTHVVVRFNEIRDVHLVVRETVVAVKAIDLVKNESISLVRNGPSLGTYPAFDPDEYPLAPFTWKAPYPYTAGEVLWSLSETLDGCNQAGSPPAIKPGTEIETVPDRIMARIGA